MLRSLVPSPVEVAGVGVISQNLCVISSLLPSTEICASVVGVKVEKQGLNAGLNALAQANKHAEHRHKGVSRRSLYRSW